MKECLDCGIEPVLESRLLGVNPEYRAVCPSCNFKCGWSYYPMHAFGIWNKNNYEEPFSEYWDKEDAWT